MTRRGVSRPVAGAVASLLAVAGLTACGGGSTTTASGTPSVAATSAASPAAPSPSASASPVSPGTPAASGSSAGMPTSTSGATGPAVRGNDEGLGAGVVRQLRVAEQAGFDRVVVEFRGNFGEWKVEYVDEVVDDPKGDPVALQGQAFLDVRIQGATFDNFAQAGGGVPRISYPGPRRLTPGLTSVREIADAGDFESVLGLGIGVSGKKAFRAYRLAGPNRLVIDVAH